MKISKTATNETNFLQSEFFYPSAREAMFDLFRSMLRNELIDTIFLPGYIGFSPKEGSGIFDPIAKLSQLQVIYYKMTSDLNINQQDLKQKIQLNRSKKIAVLIVNYFGQRDLHYTEIVNEIKEISGWIIEDNAHGFFTFYNSPNHVADATFFSLHKLFPTPAGGSLLLLNTKLQSLAYSGQVFSTGKNFNPWLYDVVGIADRRKQNYLILQKVIESRKNNESFKPLKQLHHLDIPQTFPIKILKGNRDLIYHKMNESGYGVVSLYHTLIKPLQTPEFNDSLEISKSILNLPVHQDVLREEYPNMIECLSQFCDSTNI